MSVLLIDGPKCTLEASHASPGESQTDRLADGWTPDRHITLSTRCGLHNNRRKIIVPLLPEAISVLNLEIARSVDRVEPGRLLQVEYIKS